MTPIQISMFIDGTIVTLQLTMISMSIGTLLGLLASFGRMTKNKIIGTITWIYVWIFRGTPLILQIAVFFVALPLIAKQYGVVIKVTPFLAGSLALIFNTGAYLAEIFRAGILSIDKGQMEAAKAVGMSRMQAMFKVIIPQTISRIIPPYSNEFIMILKDTSLVSAIGIVELYRAANKLSSATTDPKYLLFAALVYLFLTSISTFLFARLEKRYSRHL